MSTAISRRTFIAAALGSGLVSSSLAQQGSKSPRIGILGNQDAPPWQGFRQGLAALGYRAGHNAIIEARWSGGRTERLPVLAADLVQSKVDVIVASGTQAVRAAKQATSTIPIVMATAAYPDRIGLVESLARPGGNVTGLSNVAPQLMGKRLELLKEIAPQTAWVAVIWNPDSPVEHHGMAEVLAVARDLDLAIHPLAVRTEDDYPAAFGGATAAASHALYPFGNPINFLNRHRIVNFAETARMPSTYEERLFVDAGGLLSYAPSFIELFRRAAAYVDRILKGAKPANLPVEQPSEFELAINLKTAKVLGLTIPPGLLLRVDYIVK